MDGFQGWREAAFSRIHGRAQDDVCQNQQLLEGLMRKCCESRHLAGSVDQGKSIFGREGDW